MTDAIFEEDGIFIFAPSFVMAAEAEAAGHLFEGKALGTAREQDLVLQQDMTLDSFANPEKYAQARKVGVTVGKRKLNQVMADTKAELLMQISDYQEGLTTAKVFRKKVTEAMRKAWREVFLAGVRAAGIEGMGAGKGKKLVPISKEDEHWFKYAVSHEMRFLNKFLSAIVNNEGTMPYDRRADMYVRALTSFYESARVIGLPATVSIKWVGPADKVTCPGCEYLFHHNLYTKKLLPTTPRSGATPCLTNCRDRLLIRRVSTEQVLKIQKASTFTREQHVRNLAKIKATGKLTKNMLS